MLVATFSLPHEAVALEPTFRAVTDLEIEVERIAAHSTEWVMPCLWAAGADFEPVDRALTDDPTVERVVEAYEFRDEKYYQLEWNDEVTGRIDAFLDMEASILDATADADGWRVRIRFASRDQLDEFRGVLGEREIPFLLLDLVEPGAPRQTFGKLSPDQRDALVAAREHGYFDIPRGITLRDLAAHLDISHQTLSEHLRRATANLIDATITTTGERVLEAD